MKGAIKSHECKNDRITQSSNVDNMAICDEAELLQRWRQMDVTSDKLQPTLLQVTLADAIHAPLDSVAALTSVHFNHVMSGDFIFKLRLHSSPS